MNRVSVLSDLVAFAKPVERLAEMIDELGWSDTPVIVLGTDHIVTTLRRFLTGELAASDVEAWADLIELRDDIGYQPDRNDEIADAIFVLANPLINGAFDKALADELTVSLSA